MCSFDAMKRLYYTLRGMKRTQGIIPRLPRLPITFGHLVFLHTRMQNYDEYNFDLFWSACTLAYFGLLRVSEYTTPKISEFDHEVHLLVSDITITVNIMTVRIKTSKTDPVLLQ